MQLSHRASLLMLGVLGIAMLQIWQSKKLSRAWNALNGGSSSGAASSSSRDPAEDPAKTGEGVAGGGPGTSPNIYHYQTELVDPHTKF